MKFELRTESNENGTVFFMTINEKVKNVAIHEELTPENGRLIILTSLTALIDSFGKEIFKDEPPSKTFLVELTDEEEEHFNSLTDEDKMEFVKKKMIEQNKVP